LTLKEIAMPVPVRFPSGVATSPPGFLFGNLGIPTPAYYYQYFNDFSTYAAGDWTVTTGGTGTSALTDGLGGKLIQTTNTTAADFQANQLTKKSFSTQSGQDIWFGINFELSAGGSTGATGPAFVAGLGDTFAGGATGPTNGGIWFKKAAGSTTLNLLVTASSTTTTIPVGTLAAATPYTVGYYYNGSAATPTLYVFSTIPYADGSVTKPQVYAPGGSQLVATAYSGGTYTLANLPVAATLMTMGFGIQGGTTAAQTSTVDYVFAGQTINRY
jgi:hypothetical protein